MIAITSFRPPTDDSERTAPRPSTELFRKSRIHPEDFGCKQRSLVAAGSGADFQHDVFLVVRILGQQQNLQVLTHLRHARFQLRQLFLRIGFHLGIALFGNERLALLDSALQILELAILLDNRHELAVRLRGLLVSGGVGHDVRRSQRLRQFFVFRFDLFESFKHCTPTLVGSGFLWLVRWLPAHGR